MLVKNKGRDIGILRTMGLTEGSVLRIFFLCGAVTGLSGHVAGRDSGVPVRAVHRPDLSLVNYVSGGGVWDPSIRGIYNLPAKLQWQDVGVGGGAVAGPVLRRHDLPGAACRADEPGRGAAL